jgi:hypothetical protein
MTGLQSFAVVVFLFGAIWATAVLVVAWRVSRAMRETLRNFDRWIEDERARLAKTEAATKRQAAYARAVAAHAARAQSLSTILHDQRRRSV